MILQINDEPQPLRRATPLRTEKISYKGRRFTVLIVGDRNIQCCIRILKGLKGFDGWYSHKYKPIENYTPLQQCLQELYYTAPNLFESFKNSRSRAETI